MPSQFTIGQILQYQQISQYLAANDKSSLMQLQSGSFIGVLPKLLYMEGTLLQNMNSLNPGSTTLRGTAEYVLSLCGKYLAQAIAIVGNLSGSKPVLTGPSNESTNVGVNVTFSVSASGTGPFIYQWMLAGMPIVGANGPTYTVVNPQLSQSGSLYSVSVTNSSGTTTSNTATLTVTASLVAFYYFGTTDYSTELEANSDIVPYNGTFPITSGQPLSFTWPSGAANNQFIVVKYPATESVKTSYANAPLNNGLIPSIAFASIVTFGGWHYIFSRTGNPFSQNTANPLIFS